MDTVTGQKWLIGIFSTLIIVVLMIVAGVEMEKTRLRRPEIEISSSTRDCIHCHEKQGVAPKLVEEWKLSEHAEMGIGCIECHEAQEGEWDAMRCPESRVVIGKHPTPKDCQGCHETQVKEFANSKHVLSQSFMALKGTDRNVFEPTVATKHGCEQCHHIGNYWPDQSIGECDACHSKHRFDIAQARHSETCGECHIGPDHPHIEIFLESKHGNIYSTFASDYDWDYEPGEPVTFTGPTCATCHMSGTLTNDHFTHNVSDRLTWESQAPFSVRTQEYWGGFSWQEKRRRMEGVCYQCHARSFVDRYLLTADLCNLLYNEIWEATIKWMRLLRQHDVVKTDKFEFEGKAITGWPVVGYDEEQEHIAYKNWHHEGRRFRHGAEMMGADYTQWHGIWELQENLAKLIQYGAEHGVPEARMWRESKDPNKFMKLYPLYDIPGGSWGPSAMALRGDMAMDRIPDYWETIYSNVKAAHENDLLTEKQWDLYTKLYENREAEIGRQFDLPELHQELMDTLNYDLKELYKRQKVELTSFK
ncbi:MAG: cytochrome C [Gemmatimonadota bacterium]|nr:MAG: cytochrome C [Gemmatimonadota bacterium]